MGRRALNVVEVDLAWTERGETGLCHAVDSRAFVALASWQREGVDCRVFGHPERGSIVSPVTADHDARPDVIACPARAVSAADGG